MRVCENGRVADSQGAACGCVRMVGLRIARGNRGFNLVSDEGSSSECQGQCEG